MRGHCEGATRQAGRQASKESGGLQEPAELVWSSCGDEGPPWGEGASLRGGMRSLILSSPLASSKLVILWCGEKPARAAKHIGTKHTIADLQHKGCTTF